MAYAHKPCITIGTKGTIAYDEDNEEIITPKINATSLGDNLKNIILDLIYPIGSIYTTTNANNDPATLFGGTWTSIKDMFLYGADPSNPPRSLTGGNATHTHTTGDHTLTTTEMPSHGHTVAIRQTETSGGYDYIGDWNWYISYLTDISRNGNSPPMLYIDWNHENSQEVTPAALNTGGNQSHNHGDTGNASNLPPYMVVYIYERIG